MSSHEKIPFELNLLLQQQNLNEMENGFEIDYERISVKCYGEGEDFEKLCSEIGTLALALTKWQMQENTIHLKNRQMWEQYELMKRNVGIVHHYFACAKLTTRANKELAGVMMSLAAENSSNTFDEIENDNIEENVLELIHDNAIRGLWNEVAARKRDYDIATKNFKILLEIIDFSSDELGKLKKQYDDVFVKYQHARSELEAKLPILLERMNEVFCNCVHLVQCNVEKVLKSTASLEALIKNVSKSL